MPVKVRLFGHPAVFDGSRWSELGSTLDDAVLCYLALEGGWVARAVMAGRLWPNSDETTARANLRWRLHRVRARPYASAIEATRDHVRWPVPTDLATFRVAHADGDSARSLDLARAPLFGDTRIDGAPDVDAVFSRARDATQASWREAALAQARRAASERRHGDAASLLHGVLKHDLLDEEVLQAFLQAAFVGGRREQALRLYASFEAQLRRELGLEPLTQTRDLVATIRKGHDQPGSAGAARRPVDDAGSIGLHGGHAPPAVDDGLPHYATPFFGRHAERERVERRLLEHGGGIVTLLGPGGVGKTRLAVEIVRELAPRHRDGAAFVDAAPVDDACQLAAAVVATIAPEVSAGADPVDRMLDLLHDRQMVLLIDAFEGMVERADVVERIVRRAPQVRVLITSRVRPGVPDERCVELPGLPAGPGGAGHDADAAVKLFDAVAERVAGDSFTVDADRRAVVRIAELIDGLPLAIELAASWSRTLRCEAIAAELARSTDILMAGNRDARRVRRHGGLDHVLDTSLSLLHPREQQVAEALSAFRGAFTREAAAEVAGASLPQLRILIDASLLQRCGGRYVMRRTTAGPAAARLEASGRADAVRTRHARTFTRFLV